MTITALPPAPQRTQTADAFSTTADTFLGALPALVTEINSELGGASAAAATATTKAGEAAADAAQAAIDAAQAAAAAVFTAWNYQAMAASNCDLAAAGWFSKTISAPVTFTLSNVPAAGKVCNFTLDLTSASSGFPITWWSGIRWSYGSAPTTTTVGRDLYSFTTFDGGATWLGAIVAKDIR